jgi:hypothetical protein
MRILLIGPLVGGLIATALFATPQAANPQETLSLGATNLTLGMSEEAVIAKLAESNDLRKMKPPLAKGYTSMWIVDEKGQGDKHSSVGMVAFEAGKLSAVQTYSPLNGDDVEFGRQLYFAMHNLETEGNSHCTIETENDESADFAHKSAKFYCGKKTITIDLQKFKGQAESVQLNEELQAHHN